MNVHTPSFSCVHSTRLNEGGGGGGDTGQKVYVSPLVPLGTETLVIGKPLDVK